MTERSPRSFLTDFYHHYDPEMLKKIDDERRKNKVLSRTGDNISSKKYNMPQRQYTIEDRQKRKDEFELNKMEQQKIKQAILRKRQLSKERKSEQIVQQQEKLIEKITPKTPSENYYANLPIQPGFGFYKTLIQAKRLPLSKLNVMIPETIYWNQGLYWITHRGQTLSVKTDFSLGEYYKIMQSIIIDKSKSAVVRIPDGKPEDMKWIPLEWEDFTNKVLKAQLPGVGILQQFVSSKSDRPTVTRLFFTNTSKQSKTSYAMVISATDKAKNSMVNGNKVLLKSELEGFEIFRSAGNAIASLEVECEKIISFLHSNYPVKITEIVLDFIRDSNGVWWLLGCKGFKLDDQVMAVRNLQLMQRDGKTSDEIRQDLENKKQDKLSSVRWSLCLLKFKISELDHLIPNKMLALYKMHTYITNRQFFDMSHVRIINQEWLSSSVRVCNLCYMLVIAEQQLYQVGLRIGELLNIPVKALNLLSEVSKFNHPTYMPKELMQWRILLYFDQIEPQNLALKQPHSVSISYSFMGNKYIHEMKIQSRNENSISLNFSKLFYIFAESDLDIKQFLKELLFEFSVINLEGHCVLFKVFGFQMDENQGIFHTHLVQLFDESEHVGTLKLTVGLAKDSMRNAHSLPFNITKYQNLYIPEEKYITTDPFPEVWLEIYSKTYKSKIREEILDSSEELERAYEPLVSISEIASLNFGATAVLHQKYELDSTNKSHTFGNLSMHRSSTIESRESRSLLKQMTTDDADLLQVVREISEPSDRAMSQDKQLRIPRMRNSNSERVLQKRSIIPKVHRTIAQSNQSPKNEIEDLTGWQTREILSDMDDSQSPFSSGDFIYPQLLPRSPRSVFRTLSKRSINTISSPKSFKSQSKSSKKRKVKKWASSSKIKSFDKNTRLIESYSSHNMKALLSKVSKKSKN